MPQPNIRTIAGHLRRTQPELTLSFRPASPMGIQTTTRAGHDQARRKRTMRNSNGGLGFIGPAKAQSVFGRAPLSDARPNSYVSGTRV